MPRTELFTIDQIIAALEASGGIYTGAAAKLGCAPNTIRNYVERHVEIQTALLDITEQNLDLAETQLLKHIRDGNLTSVIFYLKTKGKGRGYIERQEHTGADGAPLYDREETLQRINDKFDRFLAAGPADAAAQRTD